MLHISAIGSKSKYQLILPSGSILTPDTFFYSGEVVEVELTLEYTKVVGPTTINITSITVEPFELVRVEPEPPLELRDGEKVTIKLYLRTPGEGFRGNIKVTVHA